MLEPEDLRPLLARLQAEPAMDGKARAAEAAKALREAAKKRGIELKLRKKPRKKEA